MWGTQLHRYVFAFLDGSALCEISTIDMHKYVCELARSIMKIQLKIRNSSTICLDYSLNMQNACIKVTVFNRKCLHKYYLVCNIFFRMNQNPATFETFCFSQSWVMPIRKVVWKLDAVKRALISPLNNLNMVIQISLQSQKELKHNYFLVAGKFILTVT